MTKLRRFAVRHAQAAGELPRLLRTALLMRSRRLFSANGRHSLRGVSMLDDSVASECQAAINSIGTSSVIPDISTILPSHVV